MYINTLVDSLLIALLVDYILYNTAQNTRLLLLLIYLGMLSRFSY